MRHKLSELEIARIQCDELHCFVQKCERMVAIEESAEVGEQYTFIAMDADTKLVFSWLTGKRTLANTFTFIRDVYARTAWGLHQRPHSAQWMIRWYPIFQRHIAEHPRLQLLIVSSHSCFLSRIRCGLAAFRDAESYYSTLAHELTHWTKHAQRLNRDFGRKIWGDEGYGREELVAELGSAFLCADLELHQELGKKTPPISQRGWKFSRATTAPSLWQPLMPSVQPITSTKSRADPRDLRGLITSGSSASDESKTRRAPVFCALAEWVEPSRC